MPTEYDVIDPAGRAGFRAAFHEALAQLDRPELSRKALERFDALTDDELTVHRCAAIVIDVWTGAMKDVAADTAVRLVAAATAARSLTITH